MKILCENIQKYKSELMGLAILMIIAFHTILPDSTPSLILAIKKFGEMGVDIFMFIGGYTIAGSLNRSSSIRAFYKKRIIRILPAYLIIWGFVHAVFTIRYSSGIIAYIKDLSLWNCIVNNSLRNWYIASILLMYLITPLYIWAYKKYTFVKYTPFLVIVCDTIVMIHGGFTILPTFMFWNRLPIYLLGINIYLNNKTRQITTSIRAFVALIVIIFIIIAHLTTQYNITNNWMEFRRITYIPITLGLVYFYNYRSQLLSFIGTLTLELYLLHELIQGLIYDLITPPWYVYIPVSIVLAFTIGYTVHHIISKVIASCHK